MFIDENIFFFVNCTRIDRSDKNKIKCGETTQRIGLGMTPNLTAKSILIINVNVIALVVLTKVKLFFWDVMSLTLSECYNSDVYCIFDIDTHTHKCLGF